MITRAELQKIAGDAMPVVEAERVKRLNIALALLGEWMKNSARLGRTSIKLTWSGLNGHYYQGNKDMTLGVELTEEQIKAAFPDLTVTPFRYRNSSLFGPNFIIEWN